MYSTLFASIILFVTISKTNGSCCKSYRKETSYKIQNITAGGGLILESPQWSVEEQALYWVDNFGNKLFRLDGITGEITTRDVCFGPSTLIIPIKGHPGYVVVALRSGLYILKWGAPGGDDAFRQLTAVDLGKSDNNIDDGKVDAKGRLWFGTFGKLDINSPDLVNPDQATLYSMDYCNYAQPAIKKRPVSISNGIAWSLNNKKMYYNDSPTRRVTAFDYDLEKGDIANETVLFDFADCNIEGAPDGMTIDANGNLWVATFNGRKILIIDPTCGALLDQITVPADSVSSVMWGGPDLRTLYFTTGTLGVKNPTAKSGAMFNITGLNVGGVPENLFVFPNADTY